VDPRGATWPLPAVGAPLAAAAAWPPREAARQLLLLAAHPALDGVSPLDVLASGLAPHFLPHYGAYMGLASAQWQSLPPLPGSEVTGSDLAEWRVGHFKALTVRSHCLADIE